MLVEEILLASEISRSGLDAPTYAGFAGIMTGFAFAGLAVYLGRHEAEQKTSKGKNPAEIQAFEVVAALFYAMASLAICAFLYSSLAGDSSYSDRAIMAALIYGPLLGISVLSLFYSMTLMMIEHTVTRQAAKYANRVVVIAGPIVVIRFLTSHSYSARQARCSPPDGPIVPSCHTYWPLWTGLISAAVLLILSILITEKRLSKTLDKRVEWAAKKHTLPSLGVFLTVSLFAIASVMITIIDSNFVLPDWVAYAPLIAGSVLLGAFAFLCSCVLNKQIDATPEVRPNPTSPEANRT